MHKRALIDIDRLHAEQDANKCHQVLAMAGLLQAVCVDTGTEQLVRGCVERTQSKLNLVLIAAA